MKYITFRIHDKPMAVPVGKHILEPTQINKIKNTKRDGLKVGIINFRGQGVDVVDLSRMMHRRDLKKFDGLLFVHRASDDFAIKFEGFFQVKSEIGEEEVIEIDSIKV